MKKLLTYTILATAMISMSAQAISVGRSSRSMPSRSYSAPKPSVAPKPAQKPSVPASTNKTVVVNRTTVVQKNVVQQAPASSGGMFSGVMGGLMAGGLGYWLGSSNSTQEAQNKCLEAAQSEEQKQSCMQIK